MKTANLFFVLCFFLVVHTCSIFAAIPEEEVWVRLDFDGDPAGTEYTFMNVTPRDYATYTLYTSAEALAPNQNANVHARVSRSGWWVDAWSSIGDSPNGANGSLVADVQHTIYVLIEHDEYTRCTAISKIEWP